MTVSGAAADLLAHKREPLVGLLAVGDGPELADDADVFAELKVVHFLTPMTLPLPPELAEPA